MTTTVQRMLIVAVLLVAVLLVVRSVAAPLPPATSPAQPAPAPEIAAPPTIDASQLRLPPEIASIFPPGEAPQVNPNATWVTVAEFNGREAGRTPTFELSGSTTRVRYKIDGDMQFLALFFVPAAQGQASAFPDVISASQSEGEATIAKAAGAYYLTVQTIDGGWTIAVDEEQVL